MPTKKFDGTIDGKPLKVIVVDKGYTKMWFAKRKERNEASYRLQDRVTNIE